MKAYVHYVGDRPFSADCASAERGFEKLGIECVRFTNDCGLSNAQPEDIVVAGMLVAEGRLRYLGISPDIIEYPERLQKYLDRSVWQCTIETLCTQVQFPIFIKPVEEKLFTGQVISSQKDVANLLEKNTMLKLWCSEVVSLQSEWRCYVKDGQMLGLISYLQREPNSRPDKTVVESAVKDLGVHPAGCSLDFGVTSTGQTILIEANDGYALGNYGLDDEHYASLLLARWNELITTRK